MNKKMIVSLVLIGLFSFACASSRSGSVYTREQARVTHTVQRGTIEEVQPVTIEGTKTPVGMVAGGATGAAVGSTIGRGSGRTLATVIGAVVGGLTGSAVEEQATKKQGHEVTVRLDNGQIIAIVQEADEALYPGMRVRVLSGSDGSTRVRPD